MNSKHICKFCKRSFPCGRSLGGHIRSHLIHKNNNPNEEPDSSKPRYELRENPKKTYKDSSLLSSYPSSWSTESETETQVRNSKGKSCFIGGNNSQSSVSEVVEPEQEDISGAMCLIMMSRDFGNWGNLSGHLQNGSKMKEFEVFPNGLASGDRNNHYFQNKRKVDDLDHRKKTEISVSGHVRNWSQIKEFEASEDGFVHESGFHDLEMGSEVYKNNTNKRSKFECTTCNKVFHSYQALGGHRASHKKMVGVRTSPVSKPEPNDISNGEDFPPPPKRQHEQEQELATKTATGSSSQSPKKGAQRHECPICSKVFSSGQALGGHKRSHLLGANNNNNCEINLVERSSNPEIRDFLDLNLPPVPSEDEANSLVGLIKPYWWVEAPTIMSHF